MIILLITGSATCLYRNPNFVLVEIVYFFSARFGEIGAAESLCQLSQGRT